MLDLLRDLVGHKGHANHAILAAIRQHETAAQDPAILALLHHILVANRFWFLTFVGEPFVAVRELQPPGSLDSVIEGYAALQQREETWIEGISERDLSRVLEMPQIPGGRCTVAQGVTQVCLHCQGHRAQIATMLRALGGTPPMTDFILWVAERPASI
jgi:uncharacterized damage-inducible protein DinB